MTSHTDKLEQIRLKYKYRNLIMKKKIRLPYAKASKLIGPDCAYHLYSGMSADELKSKE